MPTHAEKPSFLRAYSRLSVEQQTQFEAVLAVFVAALAGMESGYANKFPAKLRIKKVKGAEGCWEMTWAPNGRATFSWGAEQLPGKRHVVWLDIGDHRILP